MASYFVIFVHLILKYLSQHNIHFYLTFLLQVHKYL